MSTTTLIKVEHAIAHAIHHMKPKESVISAKELPLARNKELKNYLEGQIGNAMEDRELSPAIFDPNGAGVDSTGGICIDAITKPGNFIGCSQQIARALLKVMENDGRIKPERGSLVLCIYTKPPSDDKYLALLKLDPSAALVQKIECDASGLPLWVNYEVRSDTMPTTNERLQKAALILPGRCPDGYDLMLLDQQTSKEAADFFARRFLHARPILDERKCTERLYSSLIRAHNRLTTVPPVPDKPHLDNNQADVLLQEIGLVTNRSNIDVPQWLKGVNLPDEAKNVIQAEIHRQLPVGKQFNLDPKYAQEKLVPKKRVKGAYDLVLEVQADRWSEVVEEKSREVIAGQQVVKLLVTVTDYQEILKK